MPRNNEAFDEEGRFKKVVFIGVGVDMDGDVLVSEAFGEKDDAYESVSADGAEHSSIKILKVSFNVALNKPEIPMTEIEVRN
jgi:hypothetical protein